MIFKIQVASEVIKNSKLTHESFLIYCKLIQHFYVNKGESNSILIDHKKFMYFSNIKSNQTFKKCINQLYEYGLIENKIDKLPRTGLVEVILNSIYLSTKKDFSFAQLPYFILDRCVINSIGLEGIRLLYYFKSYINNGMQFCFSSRETIAREIGSNPKTIDKYIKLLKDYKFIKISKHDLQSTGEYIKKNEFSKEKAEFKKFNNHYHLQLDKFKDIHSRLKKEN